MGGIIKIFFPLSEKLFHGIIKLSLEKNFSHLKLDTFFTSGPEETRAWTIPKNCLAPEAAGETHTDFKKGFIRAETVSYSDFLSAGGWLRAKELGKVRSEGKDYSVKDGDIMNFLFSN